MKISLGTDLIAVSRFKHWHTFARKKLKRIFSEEEIDYCLQNAEKSAERFAVRFAAREALYKGIVQYDEYFTIPFLTVCSSIIILKQQSGAPILKIKENNSLYFYLKKNNISNI